MVICTPPISNVLEQLENDPSRLRSNWCVPRSTGQLLYILTLTQQAQSICEVGTSIGYSTLWLAAAAKQTGGHVTTIDASEERQSQAKEAIAEAGLSDMVTFLVGEALTVLEQLRTDSKSFDMAFIDAAKHEYWQYTQILNDCFKPGAMLIADNTSSHGEQMQPFLDGMAQWQGQVFDSCLVDQAESLNGVLIARKCHS